jgi:uncharacterized protein YjiS (DUF1127 family)
MDTVALNVSLDGKPQPNIVARLVTRIINGLAGWGRRRRTINELMALDDHMLKDIGLHRSQISSMAHHLPASRHSRVLIGTE